ncbi:MAG: transcriptional repressor [Ktedonobacterales bacterium]|nr:transcriptional repressor [Ktedonobacterales bacterium]
MSTLTLDQVIGAFEAAGMRATRPRRAMAAQIVTWGAADQEFSSEDLWHAVQEQAPWVGRATAYRTVQILQDFGFLDRVTFADGTERYHVISAGEHHHHLTCETCHRVVEVEACIAPEAFAAVAQASGFAISGHRVEIFGRCPTCQAAS